MSKFQLDKLAITEKVLSIARPDYSSIDLEQANSSWWRNIRVNGGLSLTDIGKQNFELAKISSYALSSKFLTELIQQKRWASNLLLIDRRMHCPYFYDAKNFLIYDDRVAAMIILNGSLLKYLNTIEDRI